ncbi:acetoacetyl-CoA reductase [Magnetospira sp. QH-2]|uniref:acetoacetyl-CoA reductase n=1 Tax=Magnetospira sp. (strain QH-2) TaxID=1288970 RepID=UPI0003E80CB2|nr:acetoacetyl-CoA reductase [Magnetospira sp. QH-2]CCQ74026.1 Acetoacetyl-coA reductase [Magnetospira sp. QH-2]
MSRNVLVTGAAAGIGASIAEAFKAKGYTVIGVDIAEDKNAAFTERTGIPTFKMDVSDYDDVARCMAEVEAAHGPIDILVNNAGITRDSMLHKMDPANWQAVINVNLGSVFNTVRCLAAGLRERGWGRIINISSMNGERGQMGQANYAAAKSGMFGFTKSVAQEMARKGVTVNCVTPGFILTDMTKAMPAEILESEAKKIPVGHLGNPEDIASAVLYLASEEAHFITGQIVSVNGGQYM